MVNDTSINLPCLLTPTPTPTPPLSISLSLSLFLFLSSEAVCTTDYVPETNKNKKQKN